MSIYEALEQVKQFAGALEKGPAEKNAHKALENSYRLFSIYTDLEINRMDLVYAEMYSNVLVVPLYHARLVAESKAIEARYKLYDYIGYPKASEE